MLFCNVFLFLLRAAGGVTSVFYIRVQRYRRVGGRLCYPAMVKEKTMKILAVCGFGMGSSMVLRFTIEKAAAALGVAAEVEHTDLASAQAIRADVVFISYELVDQLRGTLQAPVLPIRNYLDQAEVQA